MHKKDLLTAVSEVCEKYFLRILKLSKKTLGAKMYTSIWVVSSET